MIVYIYGPESLQSNEDGEFEAVGYYGYTPYSNYRWWWRISEEGEKGGGTKAPPPGEWEELDGFEGQHTIEWGFSVSFDLKCRIYDNKGNTDEDVHHVRVWDW